jgi:hypothetical protein
MVTRAKVDYNVCAVHNIVLKNGAVYEGMQIMWDRKRI